MLDFHGVSVDLAYAPFPGDPLRALLQAFPRVEAGAPALLVELSLGEPRATTLDAAWRPTFCHGLAQGYTNGSRHCLSDGASFIQLEPRLGRLWGGLRAPLDDLASGMLHVAFCMLLRERGLFDAHAAVACAHGRAFMVLGDAGAGKTSTLLALISGGAHYLGDDRVLLRRGMGIELLGYPRDFHVAPQTLRAHPELPGGDGLAAIDGKLRVPPQRAFPERFQSSHTGPITLLAPRISPQADTTLKPLAPADAFGFLLAASASVALEVLPHRPAQLEVLKELASSANAFELVLGRDLLETPARAGARLLDLLAEAHG